MEEQTLLQNSTTASTSCGPSCPHCGSENVYGYSRIVGYFSKIDNWNKSKRAEFKDRQIGDYRI